VAGESMNMKAKIANPFCLPARINGKN
jgi:hypothetical protein